MEADIKLAFDILAFTSVMVLIVLGLGVIASMMGIFNFAHGEFVLLGAYMLYLSHTFAVPLWVGIVAAPLVLAIIGLVLERAVIRRFYGNPIAAMLATFAIALVIRESIRTLLGGHYKAIPEPVSGVLSVGGLDFSLWRTVIIGITVVVMLASWIFLARSSTGLRIRGALENPMLARACGISTARLYALTFAFGAALAGLAGALIVPLYGLSADIGVRFTVPAFLSVMLGGAGSFESPVLGAMLIGGVMAGLPWLVSPVIADPLVFVLALAVVKFRPQGLMIKGRL
jgi:urea transport system permease protein